MSKHFPAPSLTDDHCPLKYNPRSFASIYPLANKKIFLYANFNLKIIPFSSSISSVPGLSLPLAVHSGSIASAFVAPIPSTVGRCPNWLSSTHSPRLLRPPSLEPPLAQKKEMRV